VPLNFRMAEVAASCCPEAHIRDGHVWVQDRHFAVHRAERQLLEIIFGALATMSRQWVPWTLRQLAAIPSLRLNDAHGLRLSATLSSPN
jgi:hypothetical protein